MLCSGPEPIRIAVNIAIWGDGVVRTVNYRAAGRRAATQAAELIDDPAVRARYSDLDIKTITRHADHVEESWREITPGERLRDNEVPVATDFGSVTESGARIGMKVMASLEELVDTNPLAFAALRTKEAITLAKLGLGAAGMRETSRLKRNQQAIDVMAIFATSSGHVRPADTGQEDDVAALDDLHAEVAAERLLLARG